ncbi:MAG: peptide-methionine (S)-S-oxide reductase MsrA [Candidatus Nanopelagicales bacterium]
MFGFGKPTMIAPESALPGRDSRTLPVSAKNAVLGSSLEGPWPEGSLVIYLGAGCYWGVEEIFWQTAGVINTSVGFMGGFTPHPTYEETCTGRTGHTETALVVYNPEIISTVGILKIFWENHDPTQGSRQGNDVGTQYRSAIFWTTTEQERSILETARAYEAVLASRGFDPITTQIAPSGEFTYYLAQDSHQQYLYKNPNGYRCHANTGIAFPNLN